MVIHNNLYFSITINQLKMIMKLERLLREDKNNDMRVKETQSRKLNLNSAESFIEFC